MPIAKKLLDELESRRKEILQSAGEDKIKQRHEKGVLTARERLEKLFQSGSFQEFNTHAKHHCTLFDMDKKSLPGDGGITGTGLVDGRPVAAFSQDFMVAGGSLGNMQAQKICDVMDYAMKTGMPIVGFNDSGGARIQEGVNSLSGYGNIFSRNVMASGVIPQIALICGPCAGGAAYSPALMDFMIMTRKNANMFICGPDVIKAVTGTATTMEEIGDAMVHASVSGNVHFVADDDEQAIQILKKLLSYLPANNILDPPHKPTPTLDLSENPKFNDLVPADPKEPMDAYEVIRLLVDGGDWLEVHRDWAKNIVVGFARIQGIVVGIVANQSRVKAGALDIDSSDKGARFIRFCNAFNIPIVSLVDVPGFLPGVNQERGGIIRHGAKMLFAYAATTVPKITLIMRKAYGGAYLAMCSKDLGADMVFAWPSAEIAVMGAEGATNILYRREIKEAKNPEETRAKLVEDYREKFASPYQAAEDGMLTDVIRPSQTRALISMALRNTLPKREARPPKKHGNIPL
ncbi:MAG: acyl-CoA carboxylase subunit beta [Verrucomicrobiota bacterium]